MTTRLMIPAVLCAFGVSVAATASCLGTCPDEPDFFEGHYTVEPDGIHDEDPVTWTDAEVEVTDTEVIVEYTTEDGARWRATWQIVPIP